MVKNKYFAKNALPSGDLRVVGTRLYLSVSFISCLFCMQECPQLSFTMHDSSKSMHVLKLFITWFCPTLLTGQPDT